MRTSDLISAALIGASLGGVALAQVGRGGSEWLAGGGDAQRTSWIRSDAKISLETMSKPGFELQWTTNPGNRARGLNGLTQGVSANGVTLFVPMTVVAGSSNNVYGIDNDTGYIVWSRTFDATLPAATAGCPGGITAAPARIVSLVQAAPAAAAGPGGAGGRGGGQGYRSVVGEPGEGVPVEGRGAGGRAAGAPPAGPPAAGTPPAGAPPAAGAPPPAGAPPAAGAGAGAQGGARPGGPPAGGGAGGGAGRGAQPSGIPGAPATGGGGGLGRASGVAYAISSDGMMHVIGLPSGKDIQKPAAFLPANAKWSDAVAVNTTLYAATTNACAGAPNAVWAIDLASEAKPVVSWKNDGGSVVGRIALTSDGTIIAAIGAGKAAGDGKANAIVALDAKTLQVKDWFTSPTAEFVTGPTILRHNDKDVVIAATKDGKVMLFDAASLGGANHGTPLAASSPVVSLGGTIAADALAAWQQYMPAPPAPPAAPGAAPVPAAPPTPGPWWILVPINGRPAASTTATNGAITTGTVVALKLGGGATPTLETGWTSANLTMPATPVIVNGVAFALSTGRPPIAAGAGSAAVLHAYDAVTGKALWNSQKAMTTFASPGSFWSAFGQVYVGTHDGKLHAFGFLDERR